MWIVPDCEMPSAWDLSTLDQIAVREQHGRFFFVRFDPRCVNGHDIRPVRKIGNATEALRLALRAISAAGAIEARQLGVG